MLYFLPSTQQVGIATGANRDDGLQDVKVVSRDPLLKPTSEPTSSSKYLLTAMLSERPFRRRVLSTKSRAKA